MDEDPQQSSILIEGYESNEPPCSEKEKEEEKEKKVLVEEEALKRNPKMLKYMQKNHSKDQIIGDKRKGVQTRTRVAMVEEPINLFLFFEIEPKILTEACEDKN